MAINDSDEGMAFLNAPFPEEGRDMDYVKVKGVIVKRGRLRIMTSVISLALGFAGLVVGFELKARGSSGWFVELLMDLICLVILPMGMVRLFSGERLARDCGIELPVIRRARWRLIYTALGAAAIAVGCALLLARTARFR